MRINHNIPALRALHQLNRSNNKLDTTLERLSSGLRINRAADDAAGLAITQKMDTQVRGLEQANRNAMDGISLIQTAEGALSEVHAMLQRIRELAVQVSNGTYDASDREAVQNEVEQLQTEIQRISNDTEFNEMKLLDGSVDRRAFSSDETVAKIVSMSDTVAPGVYDFTVTQEATQTVATGGAGSDLFTAGVVTAGKEGIVNINGEQVEIKVGDTADDVFGKLRDVCERVDITMTSSTTPYANGSVLTFTHNKYGDDHNINITGTNTLLTGLEIDGGTITTVMGGDMQVDPATVGFPTDVTIEASGNEVVFRASANFELRVSDGGTPGAVSINILKTGPLNLQIGANEGQFMEVRIQEISPKTLRLTEMNLSTAAGAQAAISIADEAITAVSSVRAKLGAYQNRLEHTIANLESAGENMTAALSRIQDADMAYEMAQFTQQNIIQQAGTSMLAQANQRPQSLLQLLQG
jgi:flagellin